MANSINRRYIEHMATAEERIQLVKDFVCNSGLTNQQGKVMDSMPDHRLADVKCILAILGMEQDPAIKKLYPTVNRYLRD